MTLLSRVGISGARQDRPRTTAKLIAARTDKPAPPARRVRALDAGLMPSTPSSAITRKSETMDLQILPESGRHDAASRCREQLRCGEDREQGAVHPGVTPVVVEDGRRLKAPGDQVDAQR